MMQRIKTSLHAAKAQTNTALLEDALGAVSLVVMLVAALHLPVLV
ncbi:MULTISPECIES: hypothetical protein [Marivita]|uniref:Uncharacterized protein n=1 Tax=Marivita lacus TaxID=1323742 RepID=A0ABQ1KIS6_9RHOB|nr:MULTISPECIES: hypothetical protein [Marivita]MDP4991401.1 hypothetical protein [Marivita lacus]GGB97190.1 hypothetical protein GCM10011363_12300 [Marivita lacus]